MNREAFIEYWLRNTKMTREEFDKYLVAVECDCGEHGCKGWQARRWEDRARNIPSQGVKK